MSRRRTPSPPRRTDFAPTVEQRTNALRAAALQASQRAKRKPVEMDWPAAIQRLKAMLDKLEEQDG